jgi:hypothetical protein
MALLNKPRRARRSSLALLRGLLFAGLGVAASLCAQPVPLEYQVKAAFLYNFARFVEWPSDPNGRGGPIEICVFGLDPFGPALDQALSGKTVNGRSLTARRVSDLQQLRRCQVLFVSSSEQGRLEEIFKAVANASVLTVGESRDFASLGGIINLVLEQNKVRFEVNLSAARQANLKLSSQLLGLARIVETGRRGY